MRFSFRFGRFALSLVVCSFVCVPTMADEMFDMSFSGNNPSYAPSAGGAPVYSGNNDTYASSAGGAPVYNGITGDSGTSGATTGTFGGSTLQYEPLEKVNSTGVQGQKSLNSLPQTNLGALATGGLQPTVLDSFVKTCGNADQTFGDEGNGPTPPMLSDFSTLDGCGSSTQGTGHATGLPSAWGYPN